MKDKGMNDIKAPAEYRPRIPRLKYPLYYQVGSLIYMLKRSNSHPLIVDDNGDHWLSTSFTTADALRSHIKARRLIRLPLKNRNEFRYA
jgi:hypothetical protein